MNEEEIANLVTRLSLDAEEFEAGIARAVALGTAIGTGIKDAIEMAASKAMEFGQEMLGAFSKAEEGAIRLDAAIKSGGHNVAITRAKYDEFAESIQKVTVLDDDAVLSILRTAESYKLSGAAATRAAKDAIALAEISGSSAEAMMSMAAAMEKGDVRQAMRFARQVKQLRGIKDEQKFVAEYARQVANGFAQAEAVAGPFSGRMQQMHNALENLYEDFGKIIADGLKPFISAFQVGIDWMKGFSETSKAVIIGIGGITIALSTLIAAGMVLDIVFSPVTLTIAAVAAATALLTAGLVFLEEQTGVISMLWKDLQPSINELKTAIMQLVDQGLKQFNEFMRQARPYIVIVAQGLREVLKGAIDVTSVALRQLMIQLGVFPTLLNNAAIVLNRFGGKDMDEFRKGLEKADKDAENLRKVMNKGGGGDDKTEIAGTGEAKKGMVALQKSVVSLTTSLQEQIATFGMSSRAASIFKLEMQGASQAELEAARHAAEQLAIRERTAAITKEIVGQVSAIQSETEALRMNAQQLGILRDSHTATAQARKEAMQIAKDQAEIEKMLAKGATASEVEAVKHAQKANRAAQKNLDMTQEGLDLIDKYKTPMQKFAEEQAHLQELFNTGKIDAETYRKAIDDLQKQLNKPSGGAIQGAAFGSAEALARIEATKEALNKGKPGIGGVPGLTAPGNTAGTLLAGNKPPSNPVKDQAQKTLDYIKELVELTRIISAKDTLEVEPSGLT